MKCLNKNSLEYQTLKDVSGISGFPLDFAINKHLELFNAYPELDLLQDINSESYILNKLKVNNNLNLKYTSIENVLKFTNKNSIEESIITLNNRFRDLEIDLIEFGDKVLVDIKHRPSRFKVLNSDTVVNTEYSKMKSISVLKNALYKFKKLYGINLIPITQSELTLKKWKDLNINVNTTNAFIYEGNIYINTDIASIDSPIHELLHIFLGGLKFTNPNLYYSIVQTMLNIPSLKYKTKEYINRTQSDILEEIFVSEFSKFLTGKPSSINSLGDLVINTLIYNIKRNIDSMLMGDFSVFPLNNNNLAIANIIDLASYTKSKILNPINNSIVDLAALNRKVANTKQDLISKGKLTEICN